MSKIRHCKCGTILNSYNPGKLCSVCQQKRLDNIADADLNDLRYDSNDMADILGLKNGESVERRLNLSPEVLTLAVSGITIAFLRRRQLFVRLRKNQLV